MYLNYNILKGVKIMEQYVESEVLELKEKYSDNICREIVSFLNSDGGTIIIGIKGRDSCRCRKNR